MDAAANPWAIDLLIFILGLCVGSFLNVVALRSLKEESWLWPPSKCMSCGSGLKPWDNIPVLSYLLLRGQCRSCGAKIHWQYPLVEFLTAVIFVLVARNIRYWQQSPFSALWSSPDQQSPGLLQALGIKSAWPPIADAIPHSDPIIWAFIAGGLWLAATLIAVTVTDFREKLIPHEITYPSIIVGILFSACVRQDILGAMAGIGASYIIFDFIAFYGLKFYVWMHGDFEEEPGRKRLLRRRIKPRRRRRLNRALRWRLDLATIDREREDSEPLEVMGGGDAVLSAVMASFLGWQLLVVALSIGFIAGSVMGMGLLLWEMRKANLLHTCIHKGLIWAAIGATALGVFGYALGSMYGLTDLTYIGIWSSFGAISGLLMAVVSVGTQVSKPYPFGPALALGGLFAIFLLPNWLYLH